MAMTQISPEERAAVTAPDVALPAHRRFTLVEYERMVDIGILTAEERVELIESELFQMPPMKGPHAACVSRTQEWLHEGVGRQAIVRSQLPVRLPPDSEPEPDVALVHRRFDHYALRHPEPADILLLIEVSDTTLRYDRDVKLRHYAAAGIPEVWIVDLTAEQVLVYRAPHAGAFTRTAVVGREGVLSPEAFPDLSLRVDDLPQ